MSPDLAEAQFLLDRFVELAEQNRVAMEEAKAAWDRSVQEWQAANGVAISLRAWIEGQQELLPTGPLPRNTSDGVISIIREKPGAWQLSELLVEFTVRAWDQRLNLRNAREAIRIALKRLVDEGVLDRADNGAYQLVSATPIPPPSLRQGIVNVIRESGNKAWSDRQLIHELRRRRWVSDDEDLSQQLSWALQDLFKQGVIVEATILSTGETRWNLVDRPLHSAPDLS